MGWSSRHAIGLLAAMSLGAVAGVGCNGPCACTDTVCQSLVVDDVPAGPGAPSTWDGVPYPLVNPSATDARPAQGTCSAFLITSEDTQFELSAPTPSGSQTATVRCVDGALALKVDVSFGDLRDVGPSTQSLAADGKIAGGDEVCSPNWIAELTIVESTGGSRPWPAFISSDYRKVIQLHLAASGDTSSSCAQGFETTVAFTSKALDFHVQPPKPCEWCEC